MALAIAVTTSQLGTAQTLIFDEVDSGVGGAVAETVGRLMQQLGTDTAWLCRNAHKGRGWRWLRR